MLLSEIISTVKNLRANGKPTDDRGYTDAQYRFIIDYYRATLIRNQQTKLQGVNGSIEQDLGEFILKSRSDYQYIEKTLPRAIELHNGSMITYVGSCDGKAYQMIKPNRAQWITSDKYTANLPKWYMYANEVRVIGDIDDRKIRIRGVFEDPMEAHVFSGQEIDPMKPYDFEYPMSSTMIDTMIKMMVDSEMRFSMSMPQDTLNDGKEL